MRLYWKGALTVLVTLTVLGLALADSPVDEDTLGLSKSSVFSTPDPIVPTGTAKMPGESDPVEPYFPGAPPVIPHQIEDFLPIMLSENACLGCHDQPDQIGQARAAGEPTPAPASHYVDLRRRPEKVTTQLIGARFVCTQCHAPQVDAEPLVGNTYRQ